MNSSNIKIAVSNSEASTLMTCETRWRFAFHPGWNYEPKKIGMHLTRGLVGHSALETFYREVGMNGADFRELAEHICKKLMEKSFEFMGDDQDLCNMYAGLSKRLKEYFEFYEFDFKNYRVLEVEERLELDLIGSNRAFFAGRADVVVEHLRGPHRGEISPMDHKFVYNFWQPIALKLNAQQPNYISALRSKYVNTSIRRAIVNQIRWREDARERFIRPEITPTREAFQETLDNHSKVADRIVYLKGLSREDAREETKRSIGAYKVCDYCVFNDLCSQEIDRLDTSVTEKAFYSKNSYRYDDKTDS